MAATVFGVPSLAVAAPGVARRQNKRVISARAVGAPASTSVESFLSDPQFSILGEAIGRAELAEALTSKPLTVFAPTNEAFAKACEELQLAPEEILSLENLGDILKYHVVDGSVKSTDLVAGEVPTLNGFSLDVSVAGGAAVDGVKVSKADVEAGNLTVHVVDEVVFPPFSVPCKVQTPQQVLAFEGWAPEVINGRLAMLGFVTALAGEITTGHSFTQQWGDNFGEFAAAVQLWAFASLAPAFSSNEGYTANPFTMKDSRVWREVFKGAFVWPEEARAVFNAETEQLNGRAAMVGCASLIVIETLKGSALF